MQDKYVVRELTALIEEPQEEVGPKRNVNHVGRRLKTSNDLWMTEQIGDYDMDYISLELGSDVNIMIRQKWESMGKPILVWSPLQLQL